MGKCNKTSKRSNRKRARSPSSNSARSLSPPRKRRKKESRRMEARSMSNHLQSVKRKTDTVRDSTSVSEPLVQASSQEKKGTSFVEEVENELQCSICSELFIRATMLNCSHTFCKYCINMWKRNKAQCPLCRIKITSQCKNITLDSLVERIVQSSEEKKEQRIIALRDREELEARSGLNPPSSRNMRRGGRGDQSDNQLTLTLSSDDSSSSSSSSLSSSSDESSLSSTSLSGYSSTPSSSSGDDYHGRRFRRIRRPQRRSQEQRPSRPRSRRLWVYGI